MRVLIRAHMHAKLVSALLVLLLAGLVAPAAVGATESTEDTERAAMPSPEIEGLGIEDGPLGPPAPEDDAPQGPQSHDWPPTDPLHPDFFGKLVSQGPPLGYIYHKPVLPFAGCVDLYYGASYFWRGSLTVMPTSLSATMHIDGNCLSTQFTGARARTTALINCLGLATYSDSDTATGSASSAVVSVSHVDTSDLVCQPGSTLHVSMEARLTRPNGTFVYYCNKAQGVLGGTITESSSNTSPC